MVDHFRKIVLEKIKKIFCIYTIYRETHKTENYEDNCLTQVLILYSSMNMKHSNFAVYVDPFHLMSLFTS